MCVLLLRRLRSRRLRPEPDPLQARLNPRRRRYQRRLHQLLFRLRGNNKRQRARVVRLHHRPRSPRPRQIEPVVRHPVRRRRQLQHSSLDHPPRKPILHISGYRNARGRRCKRGIIKRQRDSSRRLFKRPMTVWKAVAVGISLACLAWCPTPHGASAGSRSGLFSGDFMVLVVGVFNVISLSHERFINETN